ncbi:hypothetical protein VNI00_013799 [Paramarasmius palmivorus]|uniref:NADH:flavin oxidoreductase/NADH oxidase N-terminal domain-containing protein n=1 Tax=Paramarasmius palmivorus TaxID=297713 RepID=A0AAW0BXK7_9AGAR
MKEYYSQRAAAPGTLLISEGTFLSPKAGGWPMIPGIWDEEQIKKWKEVTEAVHAKGSYIYLQLWTLGRAAYISHLQSLNPEFHLVDASGISLSDRPESDPKPIPLNVEEIREYVDLYANAALNAVEKAGFDGIEIHACNGYLLDQFLQDVSNKRTDQYGGSVENRCRFALEVVDAVIAAIGAERTGLRISPWSEFQDMLMDDPIPTFTHLAKTLKANHPDMAYLHVIEPRISGGDTLEEVKRPDASNDFLRDLWAPKAYISAGGLTREGAIRLAKKAEEERSGVELVSFGRHFIANPDLPVRLEKDIPLTPYNRETFFTSFAGDTAGVGYTDYPFAQAEIGHAM